MDVSVIRSHVFGIVEAGAKETPLSRGFDIFMMGLILTNVVVVVTETVESHAARYEAFFYAFEVFSVAVFTVEYGLRIWSCVEDPRRRYIHPVTGRLKYAVSPLAVIDLLAFLPFYFSVFIDVDLRFLRVFRLLRILKLTRYSGAIETLGNVFRKESKPLFAAITIMMSILVLLSGVMFFLEKDAQPEAFGSIPHAMWWGMATLTTVGYGDVVPITTLGKMVGAFVTLLGLGMFALPAAILASGFAQEVKRRDFTVTWNLVARVPLFSRLTAIEISEIAELLRLQTAMPGETVIRKGDKEDSLFFILVGQVEVGLDSGPVVLERGEYFGELGILYKKPRMVTVTAKSSCQFLVLDAEDFNLLLAQHPDLHEEVMGVAAQRIEGEGIAGEKV